MRRHSIAPVLAAGLLFAGSVGAGAQSPSPIVPAASAPASSAGTSASPAPPGELTCDNLAGVLPRSGGGWPLIWSASDGAVEPIPGYPAAALVTSLGITAADVCAVTFQYDVTTPGTLVRFRGAEQDGLLAAYVADAQATAAAKGPQLSPRDVDLSGRPAVEFPRLDAAGITWDVIAFQVADAILEMPMGNTNTLAVSAALPGIAGPLPVATPPGPVPTENPKAQGACAKLSSGVPGNSQSGVGPDSIAGYSYNGDGASPAVMTYDVLDTLGIGPWDVCRVDFQDGDKTGRLWKLGKGGAATLQPYLDDMTAILQAGGATVVQASEKLAKRDVTTLTVTRPDGTLTWYYTPVGKGFVEFQTKQAAQALLAQLPKAGK